MDNTTLLLGGGGRGELISVSEFFFDVIKSLMIDVIFLQPL